MEVLSRPAAIEGCTLHPSQSGAMDRTCFRLLMPVGWHQVEHSFTTNQPHIGYLLVCVIELKEKRGCIVLSTHDYDSLTFELNRRCFVKQQWVPNHLDFWLHDMPCQCVLTSCIPRCDLLSVIKPKGWWCGKLYKRWGLNMQQVTWISLKVFNICWVILEMMGNKTWWMPCIKRIYLWIRILYNARNIGHSSTGATGLFNSGCITLKLGCRSSSWNASTANTPCTECNPHKLKRFVRCKDWKMLTVGAIHYTHLIRWEKKPQHAKVNTIIALNQQKVRVPFTWIIRLPLMLSPISILSSPLANFSPYHALRPLSRVFASRGPANLSGCSASKCVM